MEHRVRTVVDMHELLASIKRPLLVPLTSVVTEPPEMKFYTMVDPPS